MRVSGQETKQAKRHSQSSQSSQSLLDKVLQNKDNYIPGALGADSDQVYYTRDGTPVYQSTIDVVNRILTHPDNQDLYYDPELKGVFSVDNRHIPVDLSDRRVFLSRLHGDWSPPTPYQAVLALDLLSQNLPKLSMDCYQVADNLFWDTNAQKLVQLPHS